MSLLARPARDLPLAGLRSADTGRAIFVLLDRKHTSQAKYIGTSFGLASRLDLTDMHGSRRFPEADAPDGSQGNWGRGAPNAERQGLARQ